MQSAGNEMMKVYTAKKVRSMLRQAVDKYSEGLAVLMDHKTSANVKLRVALLSNRAQAHIHLENWRNALESAEDAIKLDAKHLKSYMRAAIAAENMQDWDKVDQHCSKGLELQPGAADITRIREVRFALLFVMQRSLQAFAPAYGSLCTKHNYVCSCRGVSLVLRSMLLSSKPSNSSRKSDCDRFVR